MALVEISKCFFSFFASFGDLVINHQHTTPHVTRVTSVFRLHQNTKKSQKQVD